MTLYEWLRQGEALSAYRPQNQVGAELMTDNPEQQLEGWASIPMPASEVPPELQYLTWAINNSSVAVRIVQMFLVEVSKKDPPLASYLIETAEHLIEEDLAENTL